MTVDAWPELPYDSWYETIHTLHRWTQVVGKVKLALSPFLNEYWHVAFHLTARGMTTGLIPQPGWCFEMRFDFVDHHLLIESSQGGTRVIPLRPRTVAAFYAELLQTLEDMGIAVSIDPMPSEIPDPVGLDVDHEHRAYDSEYVSRWWRAQLRIEQVLERFRSPFIGKSSPIHFFWGSFDLSHTRFSGRPAPLPPGPRFYQLSEDQENFACGFWPGQPVLTGVTLGEPAFYAYVYPKPDGFDGRGVRPESARFDEQLGELILPYETVRRSADPEGTLLTFFQSAYEAAANGAGWDREVLERTPPSPPGRG